MKPWEKDYQTTTSGIKPWEKDYQTKAPQEEPLQREPEEQQGFRFLKQGGPSQFSDEPDFGEMPVGHKPGMVFKPVEYAMKPLEEVLRSPGAVTEAGLGARPEALEEKGASVLDLSGMAFRSALKQGGTSEALIDDITKREDFGDTAEAFGRVVTEFGAMGPYTKAAAKILGGISKEVSLFKRGVSNVNKTITKQVRRTFEKAIRPKGSKTFAQKDKYYKNATAVTEDIIKNKKNITLTKKDVGVTGELPETVAHMEEAAAQGRTRLFNEYSSISTKAEKLQYQGNPDKLIRELQSFVDDVALQHGADDMVKYAQKTLNNLKSAKANNQLTPKYMEKRIQIANENLRARYRAVDEVTAKRARVDDVVAVYTREMLADTVKALPGGAGSKYQEIKRLYGAYAHVSKDISDAATRIAHAPKGMFEKGVDVFTGYHALRGALSWNPATLVAAVSSKGISAVESFLSKPSRLVTNMFTDVETLVSKKNVLNPVIKAASKPKVPPKQLTWDGTMTRAGTGETIPLRAGEQYADYKPPGLTTPSKGAVGGQAPGTVETTLHPAEVPGHIPKKGPTQYRISKPTAKEPVGLTTPSKDFAKGQAPPTIRSTVHPATGEPIVEAAVSLRPDQVSTLKKRFFKASAKKGMPLTKPANEYIRSNAPKEIKTAINKMAEDVPISEIEVVLRPDQKAVLLRRRIKGKGKASPLLTPRGIDAGRFFKGKDNRLYAR